MDPSLVPGILFSNRVINSDRCRLLDIGPTTLAVMGVAVPDYMDGKPLEIGELEPAAPVRPKAEVAEALT